MRIRLRELDKTQIMHDIHQEVKSYYGEEVKSTEDLQTNACCALDPPPRYIRDILEKVSEEVKDKYYGCGLTIPSVLEGLRILDLGSGSGRDCFVASKLVGENGNVTGIDMTDRQIDVARRHIEYHRKAFGFSESNVQFIHGNIDRLDELSLGMESFDLIISNCVINLAKDKKKVLSDSYTLLKPGGEMYFSDVYADRRIPDDLKTNRVLWGECLSGALYWNDFLNYAKKAGFTDPRSVSDNPITIENEELAALVGDIRFYSVTYRLFKLDGLESDCEDYGQAVAYKGGMMECPEAFSLDAHHYFPKGKITSVCGNTYKMLHDTRFHRYFDFYGNWDTHYGIYEGCGTHMPFNQENNSSESCC